MFSLKQLQEIAQAQAKAVKKDIATLVDANGNSRFIEGDITINEITGITQTYGKWSLSGTHLMIVVGVALADTTAITSNQELCKIDLPVWVKNKIIPLSSNYVDGKSHSLYSGGQSLSTILRKNSDNEVYITMGALTLTADRNGRVQYDLLIDNE